MSLCCQDTLDLFQTKCPSLIRQTRVKCAEVAFVDSGFNWKKAVACFEQHNSKAHREVVLKLGYLNQPTDC